MNAQEKLEIMEKHMRVSWSQIDSFLQEVVCSNDVDSREAFGEQWASAKWDLFNLFGERLALKSSVENSISDSEIRALYNENVISKTTYYKKEISSRAFLTVSFFGGEFSSSELQSNLVSSTRVFSGVKIQKGMKITKALKFFIKDKEELDYIQTLFSQFIQSLEAKGSLDVSIDFFDILCMSVNDKKRWRSCHNFIDGEYGGGAFSYALDSNSAIAQISTAYAENGVADKVWRQMVWFSNGLETAILSRQYPSSNPNNRKAAQDLIIKELGGNKVVSGFIESTCLDRNFINIGGYHYNDISCDAVNKVMAIILDFNEDSSNYSCELSDKDIIREIQREGDFNYTFEVGVESGTVINPYTQNNLYPDDWEDDDSEWYYN